MQRIDKYIGLSSALVSPGGTFVLQLLTVYDTRVLTSVTEQDPMGPSQDWTPPIFSAWLMCVEKL